MGFQSKNSIMSFKDYIDSIIKGKDAHLTEDWGWYIDIESHISKLPIQLTKYHKYGRKIKQYIDFQPTIKEIPSTASFTNLSDLSITEEEFNKKLINEGITICINVIGLIGIVAIYYTLYI
jgi:hypothetical protein